MNTVQTKAALYLILVVIIITVANFLSSFLFTQSSLLETIEKEISLARNIADDLVSTRINLLKSDARMVAERLLAADDGNLEKVMREQLDLYRGFMALTVFSREKIEASSGYVPAPPGLKESHYVKNAFEAWDT